jgi:hypothetical protein
MKYLFLGIFAIVLIGTLVLGYYGLYQKIRFEQQTTGGEWIAYLEFKGNYKQSANYMDRVYELLRDEYQISTTQGIGIYYDKPGDVPEDQLRAEAGCIITADDAKRISGQSELMVRQLETNASIVTQFPYKGTLSVMLGIFKVYPAMENYLETNNLPQTGPVIEIYDEPASQIHYRKVI